MITHYDASAGLYYAYFKQQGRPCLGYATTRHDAMLFCFELIQQGKKTT